MQCIESVLIKRHDEFANGGRVLESEALEILHGIDTLDRFLDRN